MSELENGFSKSSKCFLKCLNVFLLLVAVMVVVYQLVDMPFTFNCLENTALSNALNSDKVFVGKFGSLRKTPDQVKPVYVECSMVGIKMSHHKMLSTNLHCSLKITSEDHPLNAHDVLGCLGSAINGKHADLVVYQKRPESSLVAYTGNNAEKLPVEQMAQLIKSEMFKH